MRLIPVLAVLASVALAIPAPFPLPQEINFEAVDLELPEVTAIDLAVKPTIIAYDPVAAIQSAVADVSTPASTEAVADPVKKRTTPVVNNNSGCGACPAQPTTANYLNIDVSSDTAFLADAKISTAANNAATPSGYIKAYSNLKAASNGNVYMGYQMITTYAPATCATKCGTMAGCLAFNIFIERDPTIDACSASCTNPPAFPNIKCSYWGGALTPESAVNDGQWRNNFHVVIAGSNGYNINTTPVVSEGYSPVQNLNTAAINAPLSCNNIDTYMGYKLFTNTPFDVKLCAAACTAQSEYNARHPPSTGVPRVCNYFNTYLLNKNGVSQGQYCSLYTQAWDSTFATNTGQWRGNDRYTISSSYASFNLTSPGYPVCPSDITYLKSAGAEFCTSFNSYIAPHTTSKVVGTVSETTTVATTLLIITTPPASTETIFQTVTEGLTIRKRTVVPTPASITNWQSSRIRQACSEVATGTITDFSTTSILTIYVSTITAAFSSYSAGPVPVVTITNTLTVQPTITPSPTVTIPTGPTVPTVVLSSPTLITTGGGRFDDEQFNLVAPFPIGAFGASATNFMLSTNGFLYINPSFDPEGYSTSDVSIFPYAIDLVVAANTPQGLYHETAGVVGHRTFTLEFYASEYGNANSYNHFALIFYENNIGFIRIEFYQMATGGGETFVMRSSTNQRISGHGESDPIPPNNSFISIDTNTGVVTTGSL